MVKARGEAMAAAAAAGDRPHGMLSVVGLGDEQLQKARAHGGGRAGAALPHARARSCRRRPDARCPPAVRRARALLPQLCDDAVAARGLGTVCQLANYLFPQGRVVSGHLDALDVVAAAAGAAGALKAARLAVAGAFHTRLMEPAAAALRRALASVELRPPRVPVISNVTAAPFPSDDPDALRELLCRQLVEPVRWEGSLGALLRPAGGAAPPRLIEVGPGQQIRAMVRRVDGAAFKAFGNVSAA